MRALLSASDPKRTCFFLSRLSVFLARSGDVGMRQLRGSSTETAGQIVDHCGNLRIRISGAEIGHEALGLRHQ